MSIHQTSTPIVNGSNVKEQPAPTQHNANTNNKKPTPQQNNQNLDLQLKTVHQETKLNASSTPSQQGKVKQLTSTSTTSTSCSHHCPFFTSLLSTSSWLKLTDHVTTHYIIRFLKCFPALHAFILFFFFLFPNQITFHLSLLFFFNLLLTHF